MFQIYYTGYMQHLSHKDSLATYEYVSMYVYMYLWIDEYAQAMKRLCLSRHWSVYFWLCGLLNLVCCILSIYIYRNTYNVHMGKKVWMKLDLNLTIASKAIGTKKRK